MSWLAILDTVPVTLPTRAAVIILAAKSPDASRMTKLLAAFVLAEATLIVVLPETPSALVSVIPEDAVTASVLCAYVLAAVLTTYPVPLIAAKAVMSASTYVVVIVGAALPSTDTEPDTTPSRVNTLAVFHASAVVALPKNPAPAPAALAAVI